MWEVRIQKDLMLEKSEILERKKQHCNFLESSRIIKWVKQEKSENN